MLISIILLFLLGVTLWFSTQGLFSSMLHFVMVTLAGLLAFAFWEPVTLMLMPMSVGIKLADYSWGFSLLFTFSLFLLLLRLTSDKLITGNLIISNIIDRIGGAVFGLVSGVLTAGILLISLQMMDVMQDYGYDLYEIDEATGMAVEKSANAFILPMDKIAVDYFTMLSDGSFAPLLSNKTLGRYHPNLAAEADLYNHSMTASSRRTVMPKHIELAEKLPFVLCNEIPGKVVNAKPGKLTTIIGTKIILQSSEYGLAAGDKDSVIRITRAQVALAYVPEDSSGPVSVIHPIGYIQNGEYAAIERADSFARSDVQEQSVVHHWVFQIPEGHKPFFLRVKNTRLMVDDIQPDTSVAKVNDLANYVPGVAGVPNTGGGNTNQVSGPVKISAALPHPLEKNLMRTFDFDGTKIISGTGKFRIDDSAEFAGDNLRVEEVYSNPNNSRVVQVKLPPKNEANSLLGKIIKLATQTASAPVLVDSNSKEYRAIGYVKYNDAEMELRIEPTQPIRSLSTLNLGALKDDQDMILYYIVPRDKKLIEWRLTQKDSIIVDLYVK